jgi:probable H4MPT-linked C1 transfer pathway protein
MAEATILGLDVGGAHLKAALLDPSGAVTAVLQLPCPLWQGVPHLERALARALSELGPADAVALTMTGELADIFPDRCAGVRAIIRTVAEATAPLDPAVYGCRHGFLRPAEAAGQWADIASANWHATVAWVASRLGRGVVMDIGSTTADLLPFGGGRALHRAWTDRERLAQGELVYAGLTRTPLMALAPTVPFEGRPVPVMREHFATTADIWRLLGRLDEADDQHPAADQGPKTVEASARRLARMIGADLGDAPLSAWRRLAAAFARRQIALIEAALELVLSAAELPEPVTIVGAGAGRPIAADLARRNGHNYVDLASLVPATDPATAAGASTAAPSFAVAALLARA